MINYKKIFPLFFGLLVLSACTSDPASDSDSGFTTVSPPKVEKETEAPKVDSPKEEVKEIKEEPVVVDTKTPEEPKKEEPKPKPKPKKRPKISFASTSHDYGVIMQGDKINHEFKFTNKGNADLLITNVTASCGCTQPSYPFVPIKPGKSGVIEVAYDSKGKLGRQNPTITVVTNARPSTYKLKLLGFVDAERAKEQPKETIAPEAGETPSSPESPVEGGGLK